MPQTSQTQDPQFKPNDKQSSPNILDMSKVDQIKLAEELAKETVYHRASDKDKGTTKIRKAYSLFTSKKAKLQQNNNENIAAIAATIRMQLAYMVGKDDTDRNFIKFFQKVEPALQSFKVPASQDEEKFKALCDFCEAYIGFHRYHNSSAAVQKEVSR